MNEKSPLEKFTVKKDRLNEFPGKEIGIDRPLSSDIEIDYLAQVIFSAFKGGNDIYQIAKNMPYVVESKTKYFKYSTQKEKSKLFTISIREKDGIINIKSKGDKFEKRGVIFCDECEYQLPFKRWTLEAEKKIKLEQSKFLNIPFDEINQTSENLKRKLKIRIENTDTKRVYTIGVITKTKPNNRPKNSFSIEYIGREVQNSNEDYISVENMVIEDINKIKEKVLNIIKD